MTIADPAGVAGVLRTAPRLERREVAAMRALNASFPACVVAGATFSIDRWTLRPFLAEALYQVHRARSGTARTRRRLVKRFPLPWRCRAGRRGRAATAASFDSGLKQSHLEEGNVRGTVRLHSRGLHPAITGARPPKGCSPRFPVRRRRKPCSGRRCPFGRTECPILAARVTIRSRIFLRGAIAEAIYNGDGLKPQHGVGAAVHRSAPPSARSPLRDDRAGGSPDVRCGAAALLAHAVVRDNPGSLGETKALRALKPTLLACLPEGSRLGISRINFRAMIAEELYRASVSLQKVFANA